MYVRDINSQNKRPINEIIVHCSATQPSENIDVVALRKYHVGTKGWSDVGYHYVIRTSGVLEKGRKDTVPGAHVAGRNSRSIGICLIGGIDKQGKAEANFTPEQYATLRELVSKLLALYPSATLHGHSEFANKACPCFDVHTWWSNGSD